MSEEQKENIQAGNPLGEASVASLMVKFAVPSLMSVLYIILLISYLSDRQSVRLAMRRRTLRFR